MHLTCCPNTNHQQLRVGGDGGCKQKSVRFLSISTCFILGFMGIHSVFSMTLFKHLSTGVDGCPGEMMAFRKSLSEVHNLSWRTAQASVRRGTWGCHCHPCFHTCLPMKRLQSLVFCSSHDGSTLSVFYNPIGRSRFCLLLAEAAVKVLPPDFTVQGRDTGFECGDFPIFYHLKHFETNCLQHSDQSIKSNLFQILLVIEFWSWIKYF